MIIEILRGGPTEGTPMIIAHQGPEGVGPAIPPMYIVEKGQKSGELNVRTYGLGQYDEWRVSAAGLEVEG